MNVSCRVNRLHIEHTVNDVISLLRALDGELVNEDGLNGSMLYISVSEGVRDRPGGVQWKILGVERLDLIFAKCISPPYALAL